MQLVKNFTWVCSWNYSDTKFIAQNRGLIPGLSMVTSPARDWRGNLRRSCRSATLQLQLQFVHWLIHKCVKGVPLVLLPWVDLYLQVRWGSPSGVFHPLRGQTEKKIRCLWQLLPCLYLYNSPINPRAYPLAPFSRCPRPSLQLWYLLWRQSEFPISPEWGRHLLLLTPLDLYIPLSDQKGTCTQSRKRSKI